MEDAENLAREKGDNYNMKVSLRYLLESNHFCSGVTPEFKKLNLTRA
jgi:hypothetical protein